MIASIRHRATFANICSLLALTIVLGMGTAYAANTVRSKDIVNGQVKNQDLGAGSVDTTKILDATVGEADLAPVSVGSDELQTNSVNATEIADDSIDSGEIVNDSLFSSDLGAGSVGSSEIVDHSVTSTDIAYNAVSGGYVLDNSITTDDIRGTDVSGAISLNSGAVPQGRCQNYYISVPGAIPGHVVIISSRGTTPNGVILYGVRVSAVNQVTMAACNFTGGTFPELDDLPIRTVTFG